MMRAKGMSHKASHSATVASVPRQGMGVAAGAACAEAEVRQKPVIVAARMISGKGTWKT